MPDIELDCLNGLSVAGLAAWLLGLGMVAGTKCDGLTSLYTLLPHYCHATSQLSLQPHNNNIILLHDLG